MPEQNSIDIRMLELLVCPLSKGRLVWQKDKAELWSRKAMLAYPIRDDIPIMLPSEARRLTDEEAQSLSL